MRVVDYEEHNEEVRAVWEAYHRGKPVRVPMVLGVNPRYTMFHHEANPQEVTFEQYFNDPEIMLTRQLEHKSWVCRNVPQDVEMGPPEKGWSVSVDFQNAYEAGWFGCEMKYFDGEVPDSQPLLQDEAQKRMLFEDGVPDPFSHGWMWRNWAYYDFFKQKQAEGFTWEGKPIASVTPTGLGTDGPVTVACNLRGASEFYTDLAADPQYAIELLDFITEATICRITAYRKRLGLPLKTRGYAFADDAVQSISTTMYQDVVMPFHRRLIDAFSEGGPNAIHLCGDATRYFRFLRDELDVQSFDTGFPMDFGWVRDQVGCDVEIRGGPSVMFLGQASPESVREEVKRILDTGILEGGRFTLREGNNLPPGVSLENLRAMYDTVREYGRY
ncbi:MAG: hypothetical protein O2954_18140 [bacterium]|nr:hypothetical protein [bacterium]